MYIINTFLIHFYQNLMYKIDQQKTQLRTYLGGWDKSVFYLQIYRVFLVLCLNQVRELRGYVSYLSDNLMCDPCENPEMLTSFRVIRCLYSSQWIWLNLYHGSDLWKNTMVKHVPFMSVIVNPFCVAFDNVLWRICIGVD